MATYLVGYNIRGEKRVRYVVGLDCPEGAVRGEGRRVERDRLRPVPRVDLDQWEARYHLTVRVHFVEGEVWTPIHHVKVFSRYGDTADPEAELEPLYQISGSVNVVCESDRAGVVGEGEGTADVRANPESS